MARTDTVVIGAGQAGLAMSRVLTDHDIDHVVIERGRLGERWRTERWDSLHLLTPNWMSRLPGLEPPASDPDGFMSRDGVIGLLERYAASFGPPVREHTTVQGVRLRGDCFEVTTDRGTIVSTNVVIATGHCGAPVVPAFGGRLDSSLHQLHSSEYRSTAGLPEGGVLVVGAGASGLQIAAELRDSGRAVILSTGRHARALRSYRGQDLWWWLDTVGSLAETVDDTEDVEASRRTPSLGLTGAAGGRDIDLGSLARVGVAIAPRIVDARGTSVSFGGGLAHDIAESEDRLRRLLDRFDREATALGLDPGLDAPYRPMPIRVQALEGGLDLAAAGFTSVLWSTGYRQAYDWLEVDVLDDRGAIIQRRGATPAPGLFVLGLRFQWRRDSHFIDGVGRDATYLGERIRERSLVGAA